MENSVHKMLLGASWLPKQVLQKRAYKSAGTKLPSTVVLCKDLAYWKPLKGCFNFLYNINLRQSLTKIVGRILQIIFICNDRLSDSTST